MIQKNFLRKTISILITYVIIQYEIRIEERKRNDYKRNESFQGHSVLFRVYPSGKPATSLAIV